MSSTCDRACERVRLFRLIISQLKTARQLSFLAKDGLSDSALLVIQLCKTLPEPLNYTLFCDNFFTSTKLFKALRSLGIAACGTAKKGSGFSAKLLALRDVAIKSKHWGLRASTTVDEVLCLGWVDNNTVQLMTTRHHPRELDDSYYLHPLKRYPSMYAHIILLPDQTPSWPLGLPIPAPVREYNLHIGWVRWKYSAESGLFLSTPKRSILVATVYFFVRCCCAQCIQALSN